MIPNQLPNCQQARVEDAKLYDYLLNLAHPDGKSKAQFYHRVGYSIDNGEQLRADLYTLACRGNIVRELPNRAGIKYVVVGPINAPNQRTYSLFSVWAVDAPDFAPRLITAYPNQAEL